MTTGSGGSRGRGAGGHLPPPPLACLALPGLIFEKKINLWAGFHVCTAKDLLTRIILTVITGSISRDQKKYSSFDIGKSYMENGGVSVYSISY